jgi:D-arabinose 1-dehydrogenase-like Zn-dependent alcohol dehydrogenase
MLAALLRTPNPIEANPLILTDIYKPSPREHEIRLHVHCCGICHTDLHTVEGDIQLPKLPVVPGHQIVGVVEALGREARRFKEGDRASVAWLHRTCGNWCFCQTCNENLCDGAEFTGLQAAIIFAPAAGLVLDALRVLDKGGTVALAGITMTPIPEIDYAKLLYYERKIRSVANATRR